MFFGTRCIMHLVFKPQIKMIRQNFVTEFISEETRIIGRKIILRQLKLQRIVNSWTERDGQSSCDRVRMPLSIQHSAGRNNRRHSGIAMDLFSMLYCQLCSTNLDRTHTYRYIYIHTCIYTYIYI